MNLMILHWLYTYYFNQIIKLEKYPSVNFSMRDISYNDALFADIICSTNGPSASVFCASRNCSRQANYHLTICPKPVNVTNYIGVFFFFFFSNVWMWDHVLSFKHINNCRNMRFDLKHMKIIAILVRLII